MKAAFPPGSMYSAFPFAAAGGVIVLLFAWVSMVIAGHDSATGLTRQLSGDTLVTARSSHAGIKTASITVRHATGPAIIERTAEERLAASADLLDFVEGIRRRPVPGGYYLALKAYDFCTREARQTLDAMSSEIHEAVNATDGRQVDARGRLARLCATFGWRNLAAFDYYMLAEEGLQARDLRLALGRRLERLSALWDSASGDDREARQALIAEVLATGDGWLIRDLAGELEVILHSGILMIGGQAVDPSESVDAIDALWIMACEQGAACTREGEWQQLLACASAAECSPAPLTAGVNALRWRNRIRDALLTGSGGIDIVPMTEEPHQQSGVQPDRVP